MDRDNAMIRSLQRFTAHKEHDHRHDGRGDYCKDYDWEAGCRRGLFCCHLRRGGGRSRRLGYWRRSRRRNAGFGSLTLLRLYQCLVVFRPGIWILRTFRRWRCSKSNVFVSGRWRQRFGHQVGGSKRPLPIHRNIDGRLDLIKTRYGDEPYGDGHVPEDRFSRPLRW